MRRRTDEKGLRASGFAFRVNPKPVTRNPKLNLSNFSWAVLALCLIAGCLPSAQPDRTQYYALTAKAAPDAALGGPGLEQISLGVGPLRIPGYLDREELVTRAGDTRYEVSQNDRWIEPLEESIGRVLAQNLYLLLKSERIVRYPWPASRRITHQVEVEILRFEPTAERRAELSARWFIIDAAAKQPLAGRTSVYHRPIQGAGKDAAVEALSEALADLSREIAGAVRTVAQQKQSGAGS